MKEEFLAAEKEYLSPYAVRSDHSAGRERYETPCPMRTEFQRDRDRIIHSKAFRRLKHKTQVFVAPQGDHYRTRMTHTIEVMQIARTIARCLKLNEDLTEAIAWGHDLGHTPFGHIGERVLSTLGGGFEHNEQSVRVVTLLENDGQGLNLTREVVDGIREHRGSGTPATLEGRIIQIADRVAYLNHDIDDAVRAGLLSEDGLPAAAVKVLGVGKRDRINNMVKDVVENSLNKPKVMQSATFSEATAVLRKFMFENVYLAEDAIREEARAKEWLSRLFDFYMSAPENIPRLYLELANDLTRAVIDYMASMTDTYAIEEMKKYLGYDWYCEGTVLNK